MVSTPYIGGKAIDVPASALTDVVNPANQRSFAKVFMAQEQHMRAAIDAADAAKAESSDRKANQQVIDQREAKFVRGKQNVAVVERPAAEPSERPTSAKIGALRFDTG